MNKKVIGILNYGKIGNLFNIKKAIQKAGGEVLIINSKLEFDIVDKIILPGIGTFSDAMHKIKNNKLDEQLKKNTKPILGICLGMQILSTIGYENAKTKGLGCIPAKVKMMPIKSKIPHVGFKNLELINKNPILKGLEKEKFYFLHSFTMTDCEYVTSITKYANYKFTSSVKKNNIFGVQFHPEKSREQGIGLIKNFIHL